MRDDDNIHFHFHFEGIQEFFTNQFSTIIKNQNNMNQELEALAAEVAETNTVMESAITLIEGISQQIKDAGTDKAKLTELTAQLDAESQKLAQKVAENTTAEGEKPKE